MYILQTTQGMMGFDEAKRFEINEQVFIALNQKAEKLSILVRFLTLREIRNDRYLEIRSYYFDTTEEQAENSQGEPCIAVCELDDFADAAAMVAKLAEEL
ncbi:hypothetical protein [Wansuia hejianensis]|uniref:Uncharacterized protein n=1 Tax=Wansuia hejianensis TaxID=2763667 RepID=A0A7G9GBW9_9FIRM|nr:hypothetical protein [Wansuia hejianensis]QNM08301.1 hypothetical protein H9Q79_15665 [Wansuia hejianensis]RHV84543.1 hypothetical protein DXA96_18815 [Lachnospiraceae bacterium OF09-33XD]